MADISPGVREYLDPILNSIQVNIQVLTNRINNRETREWRESEFALVASTARSIARDCEWVYAAIGVIRDVERGELNA